MAKAVFLPTGFWPGTLVIFFIAFLEISAFAIANSWYLPIHAALSITAISLLVLFHLRNLDTRYLIPFCLFFIPFGPPGAVLVSASLILYLIDHYITQPISSLISSLFPKQKEETSEYIYERLQYGLEDTRSDRVPIPFKDIMHYGNYNQKRIVIEKMLRYFKPEFAPILKVGLEDPSSAIKVQAATAISFIDHKMFDRLIALKNLHLRDPEDPFLFKSFVEFGAYYSLSGILDKDRLSEILSEIIPAINDYLIKFPKEYVLKLTLAKLYLLRDDPMRAQKLLEELLDVSFNPEAAYMLMDILYELKDFDKVKALAQKTLSESKSLENYEYIKSMALAWAGGTND